MKDIDFDELDKAVNSLMASTAPASQSAPAVEPTPAAPDATGPALAVPTQTVALPADAASSVPVTVASRPPAPAVRRTGRFMDMVNTPSEPKPRPAAAPSREGLSISPRTEQPAPQPSVQADMPATPEATTAAPVTTDTMPDPLDVMMQQAPQGDAPGVQDSEPADSAPAPQTPLASESPFITDAKVEKRPLNSDSVVDSEPAPMDLSAVLNDTPDDAPADKAEETPRTADEPPASPQVPELDNELVAIESGATIPATESAGDAAAPAVPLGATSIPQQYAAQPSSGDQSHAAIYDASQYPDPIKHPAKSKSGWLWVLWVILLLGIGAGGAVLLYNLGIIG